MSTESDRKSDGQPEPFRRVAQWGRPPQQVFRAGPLPKGERLPPLPEPPVQRAPTPRPAGDILSGSMIPQARPAAPPAPASAPVETARKPSSVEPDLTVRPLPEPQPAPPPRAPDPSPTASTQTPDRPRAPVEAPLRELTAEPTVSPALVAASARRGGSRRPLMAGAAVAALAVLGVSIWALTQSDDAPDTAPAAASTPVIPAEASPAIETAPAPVEPAVAPAPGAEAPETPAPRQPAARSTTAPPTRADAPARQPAPAPVQTRPEPSVPAPPAPAIVTAPLIEVPVEPAGPPPTAADRPAADPDAPISTRPQPLGD